jgi:hypothetical protein
MTGEQPELGGTQKRDRLATLLQQIVEMDDRLQSGELTPGQEVRFRALLLKAVHQMAEETGQLPTRTAIELPDGPLTKYELVSVDMGRAFPSQEPTSNAAVPRTMLHRQPLHRSLLLPLLLQLPLLQLLRQPNLFHPSRSRSSGQQQRSPPRSGLPVRNPVLSSSRAVIWPPPRT